MNLTQLNRQNARKLDINYFERKIEELKEKYNLQEAAAEVIL